MERRTFYNEIITDHNINPMHKVKLIDPTAEGSEHASHMECGPGQNQPGTYELRGVNPTCGDDIVLEIKLAEDGNTIEDGGFTGSGCAISQASADIMLDMMIGRSLPEAMALKDKFLAMIKGTASEENIEELEEAGALRDIAHMPSRVKCAVLGWHTFEEMFPE